MSAATSGSRSVFVQSIQRVGVAPITVDGGGTVQARLPAERDRTPLTAGDEVDVGWDVDDGVVVADDEAAPAAAPQPVHA